MDEQIKINKASLEDNIDYIKQKYYFCVYQVNGQEFSTALFKDHAELVDTIRKKCDAFNAQYFSIEYKKYE